MAVTKQVDKSPEDVEKRRSTCHLSSECKAVWALVANSMWFLRTLNTV